MTEEADIMKALSDKELMAINGGVTFNFALGSIAQGQDYDCYDLNDMADAFAPGGSYASLFSQAQSKFTATLKQDIINQFQDEGVEMNSALKKLLGIK